MKRYEEIHLASPTLVSPTLVRSVSDGDNHQDQGPTPCGDWQQWIDGSATEVANAHPGNLHTNRLIGAGMIILFIKIFSKIIPI